MVPGKDDVWDREEGSCFGWIEALAKKIADDMTANFNQFAIPILLFFAFIDVLILHSMGDYAETRISITFITY